MELRKRMLSDGGVAVTQTQALYNDDSAFEHSPIQKGEFRLALLQPATIENEPICCRIVSTTDFATSYEALSYTWRNPDLSWADIIVNGRSYSIPENLHEALQSLRLIDQERVLWIDAICINQRDLNERGHQISIMRDIFQYASRVCIWLGKEDESSRMAMQFIRKLDQISDLDSIVRDSGFDDEWRAVVRFICLPWFRRVWIVQEISVARRATIWRGADSIDWRQLDSCLAILVLKSQVSTKYGPVTEFGASRLVDLVNQIFQRNEFGEIQRPLLSLETLVVKLSRFQSVDPRDRIFALLGLATDTGRWSKTQEPWEQELELASIEKAQDETIREGSPSQEAQSLQADLQDLQDLEVEENPPIQRILLESKQSREILLDGQVNIRIDYSKSFSQLCDEFVNFAISKSGSLDIIFQPWAPGDANSALSSWTCTLDRLAFDLGSNDEWPEVTRVNADPLVNPPGQPRTYSASGNFKVQKGWRITSGQYGNSSLRVMGVIVDSIDAISAPAWGGNMPVEWLRFGGMSKDTLPEAIWHTLVAGRGSQGKKCPPYYSKAMETTLHGIGQSSVIDVDQILFEEPGSIKMEFWHRAQAVIWNRSLIKTRQGRLGIGPPHAEIGDDICILFGCSVPVLLRKSQFGTYQLVSESYIFGIMDGEAIDMRDQAIETTWFDIESRKINKRPSPTFELAPSRNPTPAILTTSRVQGRSVVAGETQLASVTAPLDIAPKQFRLHWICSCGYRGNDTFMEYRLGAMNELVWRLENAGVHTWLDPLGLSDPFVDTIKMLIFQLGIFFVNTFIDLAGIFRRYSDDQVDTSSAGIQAKPAENPTTSGSSQNIVLQTSATTGAQGSSSSANPSRGQSSSGGIQLQPISGVIPNTSAGASRLMTADYLLLCINDSKSLITRDDLNLTPVVSDQQLFTCFRTRYFSRKTWIQKFISLKSLQNITFVKFTLHENQEVDSLQPNQLPYTTDRHYQFDPRPPGLVPPFTGRFLKHRFNNPRWCRDSNVCLNQMPKRIERRPERGVPPDMFIGWGIYLQDGFSIRRICFWGFLGFIFSLGFGVIWSVKNGSIADGFAVAGYILVFETITLATIQFATVLVE